MGCAVLQADGQQGVGPILLPSGSRGRLPGQPIHHQHTRTGGESLGKNICMMTDGNILMMSIRRMCGAPLAVM